MKVLLANKFFFPKGGDAISFLSTASLLEKKGHQVALFSMNHPNNPASAFSKYFVSYIDYDFPGGVIQKIRNMGKILYSCEAKRKISQLIEDEKPDIAHLHNICHQISPSIIDALKNQAIPVVMTLHDYKLTCPVYTHMSNGFPCEKCKNGRYYHAVKLKCTKSSILKSAINTIEMYLHHKVLRIYEKVDLFISPSQFLKEKTRELGFRGPIISIPNFLDPNLYEPEYTWKENTITYFGRLSPEKGLITLLDSAKGLNVNINILGEGPQKSVLQEKIEKDNIRNVNFLGFKKGKALQDEIRKARFIVIPSEWYENNPLAIIESFALGKPVVGAEIGGIPELVHNHRTGLTFRPRDSVDLREKLNYLLKNQEKIYQMGRYARQWVEDEMSPDKHYKKLIEAYERIGEKKCNL